MAREGGTAAVMLSRADHPCLQRRVSRGVSTSSTPASRPSSLPQFPHLITGPWCGGHPRSQRPTAPGTGLQDALAELSSFAVAGAEPAPSPQRWADANQPPGPPVSGAGPGGPGGVEPCPASTAGQLSRVAPQGWGQLGGAKSSQHDVPCRAKQRRRRQPTPPSPGSTCRKLVRGPSATGWQWGLVASSQAPGVRVMPGPPPRATCLAPQHPWASSGQASWCNIPGSTRSTSRGPHTTSAISSGSASRPRAASSPPGTHPGPRPSRGLLLPADACAGPDAGVQAMPGCRQCWGCRQC